MSDVPETSCCWLFFSWETFYDWVNGTKPCLKISMVRHQPVFGNQEITRLGMEHQKRVCEKQDVLAVRSPVFNYIQVYYLYGNKFTPLLRSKETSSNIDTNGFKKKIYTTSDISFDSVFHSCLLVQDCSEANFSLDEILTWPIRNIHFKI